MPYKAQMGVSSHKNVSSISALPTLSGVSDYSRSDWALFSWMSLIVSPTHTLERNDWHCRERLCSPSRDRFAPKATHAQPPEPQGSESVITATKGDEEADTGAIPQHQRQSKSKVPQFCLLPASSGACATQGTDQTANNHLPVGYQNWGSNEWTEIRAPNLDYTIFNCLETVRDQLQVSYFANDL